MKRFLYETAVVLAGGVLVGWYRLTRRPELAQAVWADVEAELCGETNEQRMARVMKRAEVCSSRQRRRSCMPSVKPSIRMVCMGASLLLAGASIALVCCHQLTAGSGLSLAASVLTTLWLNLGD